MYNIAIVHLYTTTHKIHCSLHIARNEHGKKMFQITAVRRINLHKSKRDLVLVSF